MPWGAYRACFLPALNCAAIFVMAAVVAAPTFALTPPAAGPQATPGLTSTLDLQGLGKGLAPLDGPWQFHLGDNLAWASPATDDLTGHSGWEQLTADTTWGAQTHPSYVGFAWYRRHIHVDPAAGADPDLAILITRIDDAYEVYWNGVLVGGYGKLPPNPVHYYGPAAQTLGLGPIRDGVLSVRVWKAPLNSFDSDKLGGFFKTPLIGSPAAIASRKAELDYTWMRSRQYTFALVSLYVLVMLLSLLFWLRDRSQGLLIWMSVYCFAYVAGVFLLSLRLPISNDLALGWFQPMFSLQDVGLWFLLLYLLKLNQRPRLARVTRWLAIGFVIAGCLDGPLVMVTSPGYVGYAQLADAILTGVTTAIEPFPLILVFVAAFGRQRLDSSRWLVAISAFLTSMIAIVRIASQQGNRFTHWTLADKIDQPIFNILGNSFTAQTIARSLLLVAIVYAVYRYSQEASLRQSMLEQEYKSAQELQQILVPEDLPSIPGFTLTSAYTPAQEVGGDFFQILPMDDGSTLVVLGDVSGKGLKAAMTVSLIVGAVRTLVETTSSPALVLAGLNRRLHGRMQQGFATCVALLLHPNGHCSIASAGHPSPFLNEREVDLPGALPLGLIAAVTYEEHTVQLSEGDHLALYTDGLLEARSASGELYGFERLNILFATHPTAAQASQEAVKFGQDDDITVLTLARFA